MENRKQTLTVSYLLRNSPLVALEAQLLLAFVLGWTRTQLITQADWTIEPQHLDTFYALERQRIEGVPIAYLLGSREFFGLEFHVTPDVLIPRPETEGLVECGLQAIYGKKQASVLELGTGSGAVAISIAHQLPEVRVVATDRCPRALAVAASNAARLLARDRPAGALTFLQGDWYGALRAEVNPIMQRFDVIVSNPPYLAWDDTHLALGDLRFEPAQALTDGADGLEALQTLIQGAPDRLKSGGSLWLEHGYNQAAAVRAALHAQGATQVRSLCDLAGIERVTGGVFNCAVGLNVD